LFRGKGNQGNVVMKGVLTLTPYPQKGRSDRQTSKKNEIKEGEEAPVESQGKNKNKTFNSIIKERFESTLCLSPLLALHKNHRSSAPLLAHALSLLCPWSPTIPPICWDPMLTYYYVHAIELFNQSHPLHHTVEDNRMMQSILCKTC
jgi:hypothetical protein